MEFMRSSRCVISPTVSVSILPRNLNCWPFRAGIGVSDILSAGSKQVYLLLVNLAAYDLHL